MGPYGTLLNPPALYPGDVSIAAPSVNLRAVPMTIYPISTLGVSPSILGGPIMRDGFITATGRRAYLNDRQQTRFLPVCEP